MKKPHTHEIYEQYKISTARSFLFTILTIVPVEQILTGPKLRSLNILYKHAIWPPFHTKSVTSVVYKFRSSLDVFFFAKRIKASFIN